MNAATGEIPKGFRGAGNCKSTEERLNGSRGLRGSVPSRGRVHRSSSAILNMIFRRPGSIREIRVIRVFRVVLWSCP